MSPNPKDMYFPLEVPGVHVPFRCWPPLPTRFPMLILRLSCFDMWLNDGTCQDGGDLCCGLGNAYPHEGSCFVCMDEVFVMSKLYRYTLDTAGKIHLELLKLYR